MSPQFQIGLWLIVAAFFLLGVRVGLRRQRRGWQLRLGLVSTATAAAVLAGCADAVNTHYAYLPTVGDIQQALTGDRAWRPVADISHLQGASLRTARSRGLVVRMRLPADRADRFGASTVAVYLPHQYFDEPLERFPVVYLFHGTPGRPSDLFHAADAQRLGELLAANGRPAILVAPQMSRSWTDDSECVDGAGERVETHLFAQVLPSVDRTFRTVPNRAGRTFAGVSAGGFCALNLGLRHRDLVATIVDLSGYTVPTHAGGAVRLFGRHIPAARALVAANSPAVYAPSLAALPAMRIWLDTGSADHTVVRQMTRIASLLHSRGLLVVLRIRPGGHTYRVWVPALRQALPWAVGVTDQR
jgi:enterochelin esterase-like enzyme